MTSPERYSGFQATGMIKGGKNQKLKKSLGLPTLNPPKNPWTNKSKSKKSHAEFLSLKVLNIFQKEVNDIESAKNKLGIECLCLQQDTPAQPRIFSLF